MKKNPYKFGTDEFNKFELKVTGDQINSVIKKNTKFILLKNKKTESNYNKKTNTVFASAKDIRYYSKLKKLIE